jgi:hypothetical protein
MTAFPNNNLNQTAVYWGNPINDGYGTFTFDDPVEIACRWEDSNKLIRQSNGEQKLSMAEVQVSQDLDENGILFLGDLDDLTAAQEADPASISSAYVIMRFDKIPTLKGTKFFRKAYL